MQRNSFQRLSYSTVKQELSPQIVTLAAGGEMQTVTTLDLSCINSLTMTIQVSDAPLTGLEVWVRGNSNARWFNITVDQLNAYGRTDNSDDITTTPAGEACVLMLECTGWSDVQLRAKSPGTPKLTISAGGQ